MPTIWLTDKSHFNMKTQWGRGSRINLCLYKLMNYWSMLPLHLILLWSAISWKKKCICIFLLPFPSTSFTASRSWFTKTELPVLLSFYWVPVLQNAVMRRNPEDRSAVISLGSRGSSAELAGSRINESRKNVVPYCFESPQTMLHSRTGCKGDHCVLKFPSKQTTRISSKLSLNAFRLL